MSALLKQKSKVGATQKERKTYDAFDFKPEKRMRDAPPKKEEEKHGSNRSSGGKLKIVPTIISKDVTMRDRSADK